MNRLIYIFLTLIFLLSSLNLTDELKVTSVRLIYLLTLTMLLMPIFTKKRKLKLDVITFLIMYMFLLVCSISAYVNNDINSIWSSASIFLLYTVSFIIVPMFKININKAVLYSILYSHIPILLFPFVINGIDTTPYRGIFYNPNSLGTIAATIFATLISLILGLIEKKIVNNEIKYYNIKLIILIISILMTLYLVIISTSRTSFIASVLCTIIGLLYVIISLVRKDKLKQLFIKGSVITSASAIATFLVIKFTNIYAILHHNIINKFNIRSSQSGILSGRNVVWENTISNSGIFGKGNYFFRDLGIGAHNTFISILGQYGWISLIIYTLFLLICLYHTSIYSFKSIDYKYKYMPIMLFMAFIIMSMGEEMLFKLSMIAMFFSIGSTIKKVDYKAVLRSKI